MRTFIDQRARAQAMTRAQWGVLVRLERQEGMTQAEMAERQAAEDARLQAELEKAEERIRGLRDQAMANVGQIAADTAEAIVAKLTGAAPSRAEVDAALTARTPEGVA